MTQTPTSLPTPRQPFRRYSIGVLVIVAALIGTVALVGWTGLRIVKTSLIDKTGATLALAARDIANKLDLLLAERYGDIQILATSPVVQEGIPTAMTEWLLRMQEAYPVYLWLGIADAHGRLVATTDPRMVGQDRSRSPWFQAARDGVSVLDAARSEESMGIMAVSFAAAIRGSQGEFRGVACALVGLPVLEDVFAQTLMALQEQYGTGVRIEYHLLTRDGTVVTDSLLREEGQVNLKQLKERSAQKVEGARSGWIEEEHRRRGVPVITGYAKTKGTESFPGLSWSILVRMDRDDVLRPIELLLQKLVIGGGLIAVLLHGALFWALSRLRVECRRNQDLIGQLEAAGAHLRELAHYDLLTGLPNRRLFLDRLGQAIAQAKRTKGLLAVLFLDMDHFKRINDTLGHTWGDCLLTAFAARLTGCVRESDTVSRLGGDEFTVLLRDLAGPEEAAAAAQRILDTMAHPFFVREQHIFITTSIGIALYPSDAEDMETLLIRADTALYAAKEHRGEVQFYTPGMNAKTAERLALHTSLHLALARNEFVLHYQPQVDMRTGAIVGVEALLRWLHPERGLVPPGEFIPLAEQSGLIVPIGEWVLRTACAQVKAWQANGCPSLRVAVNLSCRQLQQPDLVETLSRILRETDCEPCSLELEVTETLFANQTERIAENLQALRTMGVRLAIDDFGTGYSALNYLKTLPAHVLKLDQSFVRSVGSNPKDTAIVRAIMTLAHELNLEVIAEGMETEQQVAALRAMGCVFMQGYYFGRPAPAEILTARFVQGAAGVLVP